MRLAVFFPKSQFAAWSMSGGLVSTLRRMGHEVVPGELPAGGGEMSQQIFEQIKATLPALETLKGCDAILVSGPEHVAPWLDAVYGKYEWKHIEVPKAAWLHETMQREDYSLDWDGVSYWSDEMFVPAWQDADFLSQEMFGGQHVHWLPFAVDTGIFTVQGMARGGAGGTPAPRNTRNDDEIKWPIAFIGSIYPKRASFLNALETHEHPPIRLGNVVVQDLHGFQAEESALRMAANYRQVDVFFNLPALSRLLVTKVYEVMACGTFLMTPMLSADRGISKNQDLFENMRHCFFYRAGNVPGVARNLREWASDEQAEEREKIAAEGCREVHAKHSLEKRLETILEKLGVKEKVQ